MNIEFFVFGVPNGESCWGTAEDKNYFSNFYDGSSDEVKFLIQTRPINGKTYCYYNYLVYKSRGATTPNIVALDGRGGSYFGMSLRMDSYCKDIVGVYRILDFAYNVYILGEILKSEPGKLKYTLSNFPEAAKKLDGIKNQVYQMIRSSFTGEDFVALDSNFVLNSGSLLRYNLYDCTRENILAGVKKYGKVAISPFYPNLKDSSAQQQHASQIQSLQQQYEGQLASSKQLHEEKLAAAKKQYDAQLSSTKQQYESQVKEVTNTSKKELADLKSRADKAQQQVEQLSAANSQKQREIQQLIERANNLQAQLDKAGDKRSIAELVEPIQAPIAQLEELLQRIAPPEPLVENMELPVARQPKKRWTKTLLFTVINTLFLVFVLLLLLRPNSESGKRDDGLLEKLSQKIEQLEAQNQELQTELKESILKHISNTPVNIDIPKYNGRDGLSRNVPYSVVVKNGFGAEGSWLVQPEGEVEVERKESPDTIIIKVTGTCENVKILYRYKGKYVEEDLKERVVPIKLK